MTAVILEPSSIEELCEAVRSTSEPLELCGNQTRCADYGKAKGLSSRRLTGILRYDPTALTLVARAGTPMAEIEATLAERNQMLAFEPPDHRYLTGRSGEPTLGGAISLNAAGPRRFMAGSARDFVIGAKLVDGRGDLITSGGRVMKNVTGYDLARLFCGARGRLGMITEIALKVLPQPEASATLTFTEEDPGRAIRRMAPALRSPFELSGAAWSGGYAYLRVEGFLSSVRYRASELVSLLPGAHPIDDNPWPALCDMRMLAAGREPLWRIVLRPTMAMELASRLAAAGARMAVDWGGGLLWVTPSPETDLISETSGIDGHASCLRGGLTKYTASAAKPTELLAANLCRAFDPRGLFRQAA